MIFKYKCIKVTCAGVLDGIQVTPFIIYQIFKSPSASGFDWLCICKKIPTHLTTLPPLTNNNIQSSAHYFLFFFLTPPPPKFFLLVLKKNRIHNIIYTTNAINLDIEQIFSFIYHIHNTKSRDSLLIKAGFTVE